MRLLIAFINKGIQQISELLSLYDNLTSSLIVMDELFNQIFMHRKLINVLFVSAVDGGYHFCPDHILDVNNPSRARVRIQIIRLPPCLSS